MGSNHKISGDISDIDLAGSSVKRYSSNAFFYLAANKELFLQGAFFYLAANKDSLMIGRQLNSINIQYQKGSLALSFTSRPTRVSSFLQGRGSILSALLILSHFVIGKAKGSFRHYTPLRGRRGRFWGRCAPIGPILKGTLMWRLSGD